MLVTRGSRRLVVLYSLLRCPDRFWSLLDDKLVEVSRLGTLGGRLVEVFKATVASSTRIAMFFNGLDGLDRLLHGLGFLELWLLFLLSRSLVTWFRWRICRALDLCPDALGSPSKCLWLSLSLWLLSLLLWYRCLSRLYLDGLRWWHSYEWLRLDWFFNLGWRLAWRGNLTRSFLWNLNYSLWVLKGCGFLEALGSFSFQMRHVVG